MRETRKGNLHGSVSPGHWLDVTLRMSQSLDFVLCQMRAEWDTWQACVKQDPLGCWSTACIFKPHKHHSFVLYTTLNVDCALWPGTLLPDATCFQVTNSQRGASSLMLLDTNKHRWYIYIYIWVYFSDHTRKKLISNTYFIQYCVC